MEQHEKASQKLGKESVEEKTDQTCMKRPPTKHAREGTKEQKGSSAQNDSFLTSM